MNTGAPALSAAPLHAGDELPGLQQGGGLSVLPGLDTGEINRYIFVIVTTDYLRVQNYDFLNDFLLLLLVAIILFIFHH